MQTSRTRVRLSVLLSAVILLAFTQSVFAALTIEPITWNVVGLDSNDPLTGPQNFPVGARVCSDTATTNVQVNFVWDSANANINLRPGSLSSITIASIAAGSCADAYFEVAVTRTAAAFDTARRYHITATDSTGTVSTPTPREIYVEHLISQSRNAITDVRVGPDALNLTSVPAGGSMNLVVGNTYVIQLIGGTATQGYNQFAAFINFPNTIFQVLDVETSYSADDSPYVPNPNDKLYADACLWENDPNSPNYLACVGGDFKAGGSAVVTTYTIRIIAGGGTSETLNTLLYDFSGSSFHYNADYATGARIVNVIDPASSTISKSFTPNPASLDGVTTLSFTITNPNAGPVGGYNFVDNLPANLVVASTPSVSTSGCGSPSVTATAGSSTISFSNGTVAANSTCIVNVSVTPTATGNLDNTSNNLFVGSVDTGDNASATLNVSTAPPPGTGLCNQTLARWNFPTGMSTTSPAPTIANVTASAAAGAGLAPQFSTQDNTGGTPTTGSWSSNGSIATGALDTGNNEYFEFVLDTTGVSAIYLTFDARRTQNGPHGLAVYYGINTLPGTVVFNESEALPDQNTWVTFGTGNSIAFTTGLNASGNTTFRIYAFNAGNSNPGSDIYIDNVLFTGCGAAIEPTITKSFSPDPIAVNGTSTLTFTLTNTNTAELTGAAFTDSLPAGVQVAATPNAATTCGGTWAPAAGNTSLSFSGGTIPASGTCTVSVNVTATTSGPHSNVSGFLSTVESGTTISSVATDTLTAVLPPSISKLFSPNPIIPGGVSTLTFTITNPNQNDALSGVAFTDTFPVVPGAMVVATSPNATTSGCGSPTFAPSAGAGSISFSSGTIAAGGTCVVSVDVAVSANAGTYVNTSGNVSHIVNGQTINGNTASDSLIVNPPNPSIAMLKQIGTSATGPWSSYLAVAGGSVFYQFTIENTGDVPLGLITLTDNTVNVSTCNSAFSGLTLPVADAFDDDHIVTCVVGPIAVTSGSHTNTAHATGTYSGNPYDSDDSSATYATTSLLLDKTSSDPSFTLAGDVLHYSYLVTNNGFATLGPGPVTVSDDKATVTCPALTTVGDLDNFLEPGESVTCSATYTVQAGDVTAGSVTNNATATVDETSSAPDSVTIAGSFSADVSIAKTLDTAGPYNAGQSVTYTLLISNAGPSTATNVQVTDTPSNLTISNVSGACVALPCTIASINSGANTTITVTATIVASGAFDNAATVDADQPDPDLTDNTDNSGNNGATASADVSISKVLNTSGPFSSGQSVSYTITVTNNGDDTATNVTVADTPANLNITALTSSQGGCSAFPCNLGTINDSASATISVTATIAANGTFDNSASVSATEFDPDLGNNTDNTSNGGATASADVSLNKTLDTPSPYDAGDSVTYTITVTNGGGSTATDATVNDTPTNLNITGVTSSQGGCSAFPCNLGTINNAATATITVTAAIATNGLFDNSATVSATEFDPNTTNNTDNTGNGGATASADVSLSKTLNTAGPYSVGQSITYTIAIANAGTDTATGIDVTDTPTNLTLTNVSGACGALPCTIASLAATANTSITVTATINSNGAFDNAATATADEFDPNTTNNSSNSGASTALANLSLSKTLNTSGPFSSGQSVTYTITVTNGGPDTANNVTVTDTPTNLNITNVTPSQGSCSAFPCSLGTINNGASATITVTATIAANGAFDNSATVTATEFDPNTANNTDNTGNGGSTSGASADVSMSKTLNTEGPFFEGEAVDYTLMIGNAGPSTATSVQVTDTPSNLTITGVSGACTALPCTIGSIGSGASATIFVTAIINTVGAFDNVATATATETDPNPNNNSDSSGNGGSAQPAAVDMAIVKTASLMVVSVGQSFDYELTVQNVGAATATGVVVSDTLPSDFGFVSATPSQGSCSGSTTVICNLGTVASGGTATITIRGTVTGGGDLMNTATVSSNEADPVTANNVSTVDPAIVANVPSVSEIGLLLLGLMLAIAGTVAIRR